MKELVDTILRRLTDNPIGVWTGSPQEKEIEKVYLNGLRETYVRTLTDIERYFAGLGRSPREVKVIEFGIYLGVVSRGLAQLGFQLTVSDFPKLLNSERLRRSFNGTRIDFHPQDLAERMSSLPDETFDCVIVCETLEHLPFNPVPVLDEMNRILKPGGLLYVAVPNIASLKNRVTLLLGQTIHNPIADFFEQVRPNSLMGVGLHWREYTKAEMETLLKSMGFELHRSRYFDFAGPIRRPTWQRLIKRLAIGLVPSTANSVVVMGRKVARSNPLLAEAIGKGTLELTRAG